MATRTPQLAAITAWGIPGTRKLNGLAGMTQAVFVVVGDNDTMVPSRPERPAATWSISQRASLQIYPDANPASSTSTPSCSPITSGHYLNGSPTSPSKETCHAGRGSRRARQRTQASRSQSRPRDRGHSRRRPRCAPPNRPVPPTCRDAAGEPLHARRRIGSRATPPGTTGSSVSSPSVLSAATYWSNTDSSAGGRTPVAWHSVCPRVAARRRAPLRAPPHLAAARTEAARRRTAWRYSSIDKANSAA